MLREHILFPLECELSLKETPDKAKEKEVLMDNQKYPSLERKTIVSLHN